MAIAMMPPTVSTIADGWSYEACTV